MKSNNKRLIQIISILIVMGVIIIPLTLGRYKSEKFDESLRLGSRIVQGQILDYKKAYKKADVFIYQFAFNDKTITSQSSSSGNSSQYEKLASRIIGKTFPVLVNENNPEKYNKVLIVREDFELYGLEYPDSLDWVQKEY